MTTANKITMVRIAMIPLFIIFALINTKSANIVALVLFCAASFTDFLDGYVARKYNQITDFGKFVDPLADKLLVTAAMLIFIQHGQMAAWMVFIILAREFIITSLRNVAAAKGKVIAAAWSGKVKTCLQIAGIIAIFLVTITVSPYAAPITTAAGWIMTIATLYSGFEYMQKNWSLVAEGASKPKA